MARPLRVDIPNGWYHVTARGIERRSIFLDDRYCEHFLELLEEASSRYNVGIHAYALMGNHYHLLIQTPEANASKALQWLNVSYSAWFNAKRQRAGHVFQGRFKSVLIDGNGSWLLEASVYLHLNPVRLAALGSGKKANRAEARGFREPTKEQIQERLKKLRTYKWSSYRVYAGYVAKLSWLQTKELHKRARGKDGYRRWVQSAVRRGAEHEGQESLSGRIAIGTAEFLEKARRMVGAVSKDHVAKDFLRCTLPFASAVRVVERMKGERWEEFVDRHGDAGRDTAFYLARKRCGLTLEEIAKEAGGVSGQTVGQAVSRFARRLRDDAKQRRLVAKLEGQLSNVKT